jgi:uncharacterized protein
VFRWDTHVEADTPEFRYTTLTTGGTQLAGVMDGSSYLPAGKPDGWLVYFKVADTDATLASIVRLGGAILDPAVDTAYGRLADAKDATGARLKLMGPNKG